MVVMMAGAWGGLAMPCLVGAVAWVLLTFLEEVSTLLASVMRCLNDSLLHATCDTCARNKCG